MMPETVSVQHETSQGDAPENGPFAPATSEKSVEKQPEHGGRGGPDPTRYGDWEKNGRCIDF